MMPDPGFYEQCLQRAYADLQAAAKAPRKKTGARRKKAVGKTQPRGARALKESVPKARPKATAKVKARPRKRPA